MTKVIHIIPYDGVGGVERACGAALAGQLFQRHRVQVVLDGGLDLGHGGIPRDALRTRREREGQG